MMELHLADFELYALFEDGDDRVVILKRRDCRFQYALMRFWHPAEEDEGLELGWQGEMLSGIFDSADLAISAAYEDAPWISRDVGRKSGA